MHPNLKVTVRILVLVVFLGSTVNARAEFTLLGGMFKGNEPGVASLSGYEPCQTPLGYQQAAFSVNISGSYNLNDALDNLWGYGTVAVFARVYQDHFDPQAPDQNVLKKTEYWRYTLNSGVNYVLVVQKGCASLQEGPWAIWFDGPGLVSSLSILSIPDFTRGEFSKSDPTMPSACAPFNKSVYKQSGPIRVSRDGLYYFSDTSMKWSTRICLQVYTEPLNPANPTANRVGYAMYGRPRIGLEAGRDYYFVTQKIAGQPGGEFLYVLAPPAPFRINAGLAGSWYNPETPGQGFFLTFFQSLNKAFLGWFTYSNTSSVGGDFAHRWMTAFGPFDVTVAELDIDWTSNGTFEAARPEPEHFRDGTIELEFTDCKSGEIRYAWEGDGGARLGASGVIPIRRIVNDSTALCESLYRSPGLPGPL
ncbi:hypothetical protein ACFL00_02595 [Pseudomonadota bacterium]